MKVVHSQLNTSTPQPKKLTKKQQFQLDMEIALRRREYADWVRAGSDPEIIALEAKAREINPNYKPVFKG